MKNHFIFIAYTFMIALLIASCHTQKKKWPIVLDQIELDIQTTFNEMDSIAGLLSTKIAGQPDDSALINVYLQQDLGRIEGVTEHCFITSEGILKIIAPEDYYRVEGTDISNQDHIIKVKQTRKPALSGAFRAVEGYQSIALANPILSSEDELLGITVLLIQPELFLRNIISKRIAGIPGDIWVMQKDGHILYDFDQEEIGRNLFTDPLYHEYAKSLRAASRITEEEKGMSVCEFSDPEGNTPVLNQIFWTTVGIHGTEWKIVLTVPIGVHEIHRTTATLGLKSAPQRLYELCSDSVFQSALAGGDRDVVNRFFKEFYDAYPVYTIEWVDPTVTTRFGYPPQYSLEDHPTTPDNIEQRAFYDAVVNREETTLELRLLEGNAGTFRLCPVNYKDQHLGSIYYLVLKR
jgi:hypothetical protein